MPKQYSRSRRVADLVKRELAVLIQREMIDSQLGMITISAADISPDLKNAKIYVTCLGGEHNPDKLIHRLNEMAGHYRYELSKLLQLRSVPRLRFAFDESIQRGRELSELIDSLQEKSD